MTDLIGDAIVAARDEGFDVFNALDIMENEEIFEVRGKGLRKGGGTLPRFTSRCWPE
jgi:hypothetical protein